MAGASVRMHPRHQQIDHRTASWPYVDWLAAHTPLPLVVKGIMTAEDARLCAEHGCAGSLSQTMGLANWTPRLPASRCCPRLWTPCRGNARCIWTATSAAAPMY